MEIEDSETKGVTKEPSYAISNYTTTLGNVAVAYVRGQAYLYRVTRGNVLCDKFERCGIKQ
jgi:hypothetical protein